MVTEKRAEKKLPALLIDLPATSREGAAQYARAERAIRKLKRQDPGRYRSLVFGFAQSLRAIDQELTRQAQLEIDDFNRRHRRKR